LGLENWGILELGNKRILESAIGKLGNFFKAEYSLLFQFSNYSEEIGNG
jgi:hypothetical protein